MRPVEVTVIDYGFGNVRSVVNALETVELIPKISSEPEEVVRSPYLLLPGVGAFGSAMKSLSERGLDQAIGDAVSQGSRLLGICLGMQLLLESSEEFGFCEGLGLIRGEVKPLVPLSEVSPSKRATHIAWATVSPEGEGYLSELFRGTGHQYYFVHSFSAHPEPAGANATAGTATYLQKPFVAAVEETNVLGVQFHPERSGQAGLNLLAKIFDSASHS